MATLQYDQETDTLTVELGSGYRGHDEDYPYEMGDFSATFDDMDRFACLTIRNATRFLTQMLQAGVTVAGAPGVPLLKNEVVWYDADSSMISAFGYNQATQELDVAFHRTGTYRYFNVPQDVFEGLRDASSQGSYMRNFIIDMYPEEKRRGRSGR